MENKATTVIDKSPVRIELDVNLNNAISYYMLLSSVSPINRLYVKNLTDTDLDNVTVSVHSEPAFLLPQTITGQRLPRRTTVNFSAGNALSPVFMVALDKHIDGEIIVRVAQDGKQVAESRSKVFIAAFNECDFSMQPEALVTFVKRTAETNYLHAMTEKKLDGWKIRPKKFYEESSRNDARYYLAAAYSVLSDLSLIKKPDQTARRVMLSPFSQCLDQKMMTQTELALLLASVLESAGLNAVIGLSGGNWYVGAFLNEECFPVSVIDDASLVENRIDKSVGDISMIAVSGIFEKLSFESNETKTVSAIKRQDAEFFVDVKHCRMTGIRPLPTRIRTSSGYDIAHSSEYDASDAPKKLTEYRGPVKGSVDVTKQKQWERRLLDLDMKNSMLNFRPSSNTVKILTASLEDFMAKIPAASEYEIRAAGAGEENILGAFAAPFEKTVTLKPVSDYILYEYKSKHLKTILPKKELDAGLLSVFRKEKTRKEETGTSSLHLAAGFLKWCEKDGSEFRFAPIMLYPVTLNKKGGVNPIYTVELKDEEVHINTTLLEYLYQQFGIDIRALADVVGAENNFHPILMRFKKEISVKKGWAIYDSVYLASLSFSSYLMWQDVRTHGEKLKENRVISSLISGVSAFSGDELVSKHRSSDEAYTGSDRIFLPISADSSQYSAIVDSLGKSFVLHGPPGTGKSQTITNIIANNIVRGRRVLFVAEKMAALQVVYKRLCDIGISDFCLELYSEKTKKTDVAAKIVNTVSLAGKNLPAANEDSRSELSQYIDTLQGEINALHRKHAIGFSIYEGVIGYLEYRNAPDVLSIDTLFYEKLNKESFAKGQKLLTRLSVRAKECGNIEKSPFRDIGAFEYTDAWRVRGESILHIYLKELKALRSYAKSLVPVFNMRSATFSFEKLSGLYQICRLILDEPVIRAYFSAKAGRDNLTASEKYLSYIEVDKKLTEKFALNYGTFPKKFDFNYILQNSGNERSRSRAAKKYAFHCRIQLPKESREEFFDMLLKIANNRSEIEKAAIRLNKILDIPVSDHSALLSAAQIINRLMNAAKSLYAEFDVRVFYECCRYAVQNHPLLYLEFYINAFERVEKSGALFREIFAVNEKYKMKEINAEIDYTGTLIRSLDLVPGWCEYQEAVKECRENGFEFVLEPLSTGDISPDDVLSCFKKCVYYNFVRNEISLDPGLCRFSGVMLEELIDRFRQTSDEFERLTRVDIYSRLVASLPLPEDEGAHSLEKVFLMRAQKTNMKGMTIRNLFSHIPALMRSACPCMLMSPSSVSQFLDMNLEKFDLVVFDEASQVPTCKAVGTIARAENVIVVGDPKQLPPTTFFGAEFKSEEFPELEDLDSILDDCLAIGMPERHLLWHYRSHHESLIAFSNAMYYQNALFTFPSPSERSSKVTLCYTDGVYERGGAKRNKKEATELVKDIVSRLKNPLQKHQSIGVVTFNTAQQNHIEDVLTKALRDNGLEAEAYERDEPIFVKNLENVQGDERDVILFSVGYGPDREGRLSLNFGPLNQAGGYRRLNVAVTRARMEMKVFSSIKGNMIDLSRTPSKGVKGLKAFLEYAERGKEMLAYESGTISIKERGIGEHLAADLTKAGLACVYDLGVSDFKIDVAVVDPRDSSRYLLAIICDSENVMRVKGVRDRVAMQTKILKTLGWNVAYVWTVNYITNPRREISRIKELVAGLLRTKAVPKKSIRESLNKYKKTYRPAGYKPAAKGGADYVLSSANAENINARAVAYIKAEGPIDRATLIDRLLTYYSVQKTSKKAVGAITDIVDSLVLYKKSHFGEDYFLSEDCETFRPLGDADRREFSQVYPYEIVAAARCTLDNGNALLAEELHKEIMRLLNVQRKTKAITDKIELSLSLGIKDGHIIQTVDGKYTC